MIQDTSIARTRWVTGPLAAFDLALGLGALLLPDVYMGLVHGPEAPSPAFLLARTGVLWLGFAAAEALAFAAPRRWPVTVAIVGAFRLLDVPADLVYLATTSPCVTALGRASLLFAPAFNLVAGVVLLRAFFAATESAT